MTTWRTGTKLRRTLYRDEVCVGMVDAPEIAAEIVEAMNRASATIDPAETEQHINELESGLCWSCKNEEPCGVCGIRMRAAAHLRALQQRVTELEGGAIKALEDWNAKTELVESLQTERDAAKRENAELREEVARLEDQRDGRKHQVELLRSELEQKTRDYATLSENHTELQREYRELKAAVLMLANNARSRWFLWGDSKSAESIDVEEFNGDPIAALKRLHARNR